MKARQMNGRSVLQAGHKANAAAVQAISAIEERRKTHDKNTHDNAAG